MIASFTKWDNSLSGTLEAGPMGVPLSEVLLYQLIDILYWLKYICMFTVISIQCSISVQVGIRIQWEYITDICEYIFYQAAF